MFIPTNCILETNSIGSCIKTKLLGTFVEPVLSKYIHLVLLALNVKFTSAAYYICLLYTLRKEKTVVTQTYIGLPNNHKTQTTQK